MNLRALEEESLYILREARASFTRPCLLWSFGKDSTVLLHLARKAYGGELPFPALHCDTGLEMDEVYAYRDTQAKAWNVPLLTQPCPPLEGTDPTLPPAARVGARKTLGLKQAVRAHGFNAILTAIRRDEEAVRAKERVFSPRDENGAWEAKHQPPEFFGHYPTAIPAGGHMRVHPLLHWGELDVWRYIHQESIPVVDLYFAKNGQRYRSLGEKGITFPVESRADSVEKIITELEATRIPERHGRPMGTEVDESSFERLRRDGYL